MNRPFVYFCRQCNDPLRERNWIGASEDLWSDAGRLRNPLLPGANIGQADIVVDFSSIEYYRPPTRLLETQFLRGLIAVHQGGVFSALIHPFAIREKCKNSDPIAWVKPDKSPDGIYVRAYPPQLIDGRFVVFSSRLGASCVDTWSLKGWSRQGPRQACVLKNHENADVILACAPFPLEGTTIGLVLYSESKQEYRWKIVDIQLSLRTPVGVDSVITKAFDDSVELPGVTGTPIQKVASNSSLLSLATPQGHWCWLAADAANCRVDRLVRTWPNGQETPTTSKALLDTEIDDEVNFRTRRQFQSFSRGGRGDASVEWYFQATTQQRRAQWLNYTIKISRDQNGVLSCRALHPQLVCEDASVKAVGVHCPNDENPSQQELVFADERQFMRHIYGNLDRSPPFEGVSRIATSMGLQFMDPLLITVANKALGLSLFSISDGLRKKADPHIAAQGAVRTDMQRSDHLCDIKVSELWSDPCIWNRHLFTVERDENRLQLKHRLVAEAEAKPT